MKNKTYRNFMRVMKMLAAKGYDAAESENLTRKVFDNVEADKGRGDRTAEYFVSRIMTKEEFLAMCGTND